MTQIEQKTDGRRGNGAPLPLPHRPKATGPSLSSRIAYCCGCLVWAILCLILVQGPAPANANAPKASKTLQLIKQRGEIVVGVKTDFAPFGFLDAAGQPVGFEVDLAEKLAQALGVRLKLQSVTTENRFQRLEQGLVDIIIATAADTQERRLLATPIEPAYFGGGVNVLLRPDSTANTWQDLRGQQLCALQSTYFNKSMTQRYLIDLVLFRSVRDAILALQDARCIGFLYTDVALNHYIGQADFKGYRMFEASAMVASWVASIHRAERGTDYEILVGDVFAAWQREGAILALEQRWGVRPSRFVRDTNQLWSQLDDTGAPLCRRDTMNQWPVACRNQAFITSEDVTGGAKFGLWLKEQFGLNVSVIYDPFDKKRYIVGLLHTILISVASTAVAFAIGYLGAKAMSARAGLGRVLLAPVANVARMAPPILQMYILFFGVSSWLFLHFGVSIAPIIAAILALSLYHGGIIIFALADGANVLRERDPRFRFHLRMLPELLAVSAVGVRSSVNNLIKATTVAASISVPELLSATIAITGDQGNPEIMMPLLLLMFLIYTSVFMALWMRLEKHVVAMGGR